MNPCLAYFITFNCFGARLPGAEEGSVDWRNNQHGTPQLPASRSRLVHAIRRQNEPAFELNETQRTSTLAAILEVCKYRDWEAFAVHVRTTHVHVVLHALDKPERVMGDFKAYATRRLKQMTGNANRKKFWARHGSTRYLWKVKDVEQALHYVVHEQGGVMALFKTVDEGGALGRVFERVFGVR